MSTSIESERPSIPSQKPHAMTKLALAALGVVYGDIGTSPLYAIKECFTAPHGVARTVDNIYGVLSLVFWSLMLVIVFKYLTYIMRADNRSEGGILALLALVTGERSSRTKSRMVLVFAGLFGAALLYGDGMITPAITVLGAVEGLNEATSACKPYVVPITIAILLGLFLIQKHGTARIGALFGPATLIWFAAIAAAGLPWIVRTPRILWAVNPLYAVRFFVNNRMHGFLVLGSVVLCITGGEALYADMGHFGKTAIRRAWYFVVFPALLINYFGQGALLLQRGDSVVNPFYGLVHGWVLYPMVAIATVAAVVASQALISGAFSLTQQAVQLGFSPRVHVVHTSGDTEGQIYIPEVNHILMVACILLVLVFRSSGGLAAAYGIAVTGTMSITSLLFYVVARERWNWSALHAGTVVGVFLVFDVAFLASNLIKIEHGGWVPILIGACVFTIMTTWKRGRSELGAYLRGAALPMDIFLRDVAETKPHRVSGTAVFMTSSIGGAPPVLLHHYKHNKVLHSQVIVLSIVTIHEPEVKPRERVQVVDYGQGFYQVIATYGFMQAPTIADIFQACASGGLNVVSGDTSFFLGRETLLTTGRSGMANWRKVLFGFLSRNARTATAFFQIPPNRVVEMGIQIEL